MGTSTKSRDRRERLDKAGKTGAIPTPKGDIPGKLKTADYPAQRRALDRANAEKAGNLFSPSGESVLHGKGSSSVSTRRKR